MFFVGSQSPKFMPPLQATAPNPAPLPSTVQQVSAAGCCIYPGCTRPVYVEAGKTHQFCGRTHAMAYQQTQATSTATGETQATSTATGESVFDCIPEKLLVDCNN